VLKKYLMTSIEIVVAGFVVILELELNTHERSETQKQQQVCTPAAESF
jgi:hypothetical protein